MQIDFADAQQALSFLLPQILTINTEVDMMEYPDFNYARLMHVNTDGGMWSQGQVHYSGDIAGAADWMSAKGFDMPKANVSRTQHLRPNYLAGIGYEYTRSELEQAAQADTDLNSDKAEAARTVAESYIYGIAMRGDTTKNLTGLVNNGSVPRADVPNDGTGSARTFASKTATQVLRDVNACLNAPFNSTLETKRANRLLLPTTKLQYLAETPRSEHSDMTILAFLKENNSYTLETGQQLEIIGTRELETAGSGNTARMMAYSSDKNVVQMHLPGPHEFLEPFQANSLLWEIGGIMNIGGVEFRRPKGAAYRDGI